MRTLKNLFYYVVVPVGTIDGILWGFWIFCAAIYAFGNSESTGDFGPWWMSLNKEYPIIAIACAVCLLATYIWVTFIRKSKKVA